MRHASRAMFGGPGFDLGADAPIDGFVLARTAGYSAVTVKPTPLQVVLLS